MRRIFTLFIISVIAFTAAAAPKPVRCSVEIMPNYILHLFAAANIWDIPENAYAGRYACSVDPEDLHLLYSNRELIAWANGRSGDFAWAVFFFPFSSEVDFEQYVAWLKMSAANLKGSVPAEVYDTACEITLIVENNYQTYLTDVWPGAQALLTEAARRIDAYFEGRDVIGQWERNLGLGYPCDGFIPVLTHANGVETWLPSANDLGCERNNFGVNDSNIDYICDLVVHEAGIFTIKPVIERLYGDPHLQNDRIAQENLIYVGFETFAEKRKDDIFDGEPHIFLHQWPQLYEWFYGYYAHNDVSGADPFDLIKSAVLSYLADGNIAQ